MHAFTSIDKNGHIVETIPPKCGTFALSMIIIDNRSQRAANVSLGSAAFTKAERRQKMFNV